MFFSRRVRFIHFCDFEDLISSDLRQICTKFLINDSLFFNLIEENRFLKHMDVDVLSFELVLIVATQNDILIVDLFEFNQR